MLVTSLSVDHVLLLLQWAFGVTLWELMTLGQTPYVDIDPFEMSAYLKDGYRIAQPINCPDELYVGLWKTQTHCHVSLYPTPNPSP